MAGRLGIIDWGIGGVSIYGLVKEQIGDVSVTYFSDTGAKPYGKMPRRELAARLDLAIAFLKSRGVTNVVIGCNAASTAIPDLADHRIPVEGVIEPAIRLTADIAPARLGVIGGRRTITSGAYRKGFAARGMGVTQRIAQPLSALIESGDVGSEDLRTAAKRILGPLRNCSHILLACTHYPAITPLLQQLVSTETQFIDPASEMIGIIRRWRLPHTGGDVFLTTGDAEAMKTAAAKAFGVTISTADKVSI
ncbi:MAG: aspartate/glutamate racemase family protein [Pyrinomonadaceae bacterium]|nr:aspartate/glutamate racemase family protein [Pyrinomonadaceae bacterium]